MNLTDTTWLSVLGKVWIMDGKLISPVADTMWGCDTVYDVDVMADAGDTAADKPSPGLRNSQDVPPDVYISFNGKGISGSNSPRMILRNGTVSFYQTKKGKVQLSMYQADGRLVKVLSSGMMNAGWHRISYNKSLGCGMYLLRLNTGGKRESVRMVTVN
jgi:hypothetical protein